MKKIYSVFLFLTFCSVGFAQTNPDGTEYMIGKSSTDKKMIYEVDESKKKPKTFIYNDSYFVPNSSKSNSGYTKSESYEIIGYSGSYNNNDFEPISTAPPGGFPTPIPIDGGVGLLLVAGVSYGLNSLRKKK